MNKEYIIKVLLTIILSWIGVGLLRLNVYIMILLVILVLCYLNYEKEKGIEVKSKIDTEELTNKVKSTSSDAHLKHKQLITMVSNIPLPLLLLDEYGKVVMYNEQFEIFKKSQRSEQLNYNDNDFIDVIKKFISDAFILEKKFDRNIEYDGKSYEAIAIPITSRGLYSGCVFLFQDMSKAKEKEEMQKQFIADASHELKTPIAAIKGMVEILNREDFDDDETRIEFLKQIEIENNRLEKIVLSLLQLSKLNRENIVLERKQLDFNQLLDKCVNSFDERAKKNNIKIIKDYQNNNLVFADEEKMTIVINNIISNAIKYSNTKEIKVTTLLEDDYYVLEISDSGKGMKKEELDKIFERFYRIDKDRSRFSGGVGIGLAIVKSICEAHDFKINVESEENVGTSFKIYMKY